MMQNEMKPEQILIQKTTKSGMVCHILPMTEYGEKMATLVVQSGGNDIAFLQNTKSETTVFPKGIAHFIEHKLFRQKWGDAFVQLEKQGATANAFTDAEKTVYYFTCRENFMKNLKLLLEFVGESYFLPEEVQKEVNIIQREIQMYGDNPDWIGYYQMLEAMYANHPVKHPIAGDVDSVAKITAEKLELAYNCLYSTDRFSLVCGGDVPINQILRLVEKMEKKPSIGTTVFPIEPPTIGVHYVGSNLELSQPQFQIGCKMEVSENTSKRKMEMLYFLELLFGETSDFYKEAYHKGYLEEPMSCAYFQGRGYAFFACSGVGAFGKEILSLMETTWNHLLANGINEEHFLRIQKKLMGSYLRKEQSVVGMVLMQVDWVPEKATLGAVKTLLERVQKEDIEKLLQYTPFPDKMVLSVIR
ncbi:EF-P 5-aminopentanol modification-associated protein YfmH [Chakrabartyella piscis]|uniref:EF-P 5-aminopentanol modification-associated protein YfmH n=1 Tax=Chakrabartyella piscis TaxID=2918914 RepID=UPI002958D099|nr:pitrilysin family protein [Chakrabartyella piscis]